MTMDPEQIYAALIDAGDAWSEAEAAASLLEETRKSVLAKLMNEAAASSVAAKEMEAQGDDTYVDFVNRMVQARKAANKAKVRYDSGKVLAELRRSQESTRRAEMSLR